MGWEGMGEVNHLFQSVYVCVSGGRDGVKGTGEVNHLFQTALTILANKYFHFGQF